MRLVFSTTDHMNTDISDEQGVIHYTISTPSGLKKVTTITKYCWSGSNSVPEIMGVIQWHQLKLGETVFHFDGRVISADTMLQKCTWDTYVCFDLALTNCGLTLPVVCTLLVPVTNHTSGRLNRRIVGYVHSALLPW